MEQHSVITSINIEVMRLMSMDIEIYFFVILKEINDVFRTVFRWWECEAGFSVVLVQISSRRCQEIFLPHAVHDLQVLKNLC